MEVIKATSKDLPDILSFINQVFTETDRRPTDFTKLLPQLYGPGVDTAEYHFTCRHEGQIVATLILHPMSMDVGGHFLQGAGIGNVSVHPNFRSMGLMQKLMAAARRETEEKGFAFCFLGGQRQRYENFGFVPSGSNHLFAVDKRNLLGLSTAAEAEYTMHPILPDTPEVLSALAYHNTQHIKAVRTPENFLQKAGGWMADVRAIYKNGTMCGYYSLNKDARHKPAFQELLLEDTSMLPDFLAAFMRTYEVRSVDLLFAAEINDTGRLLSTFCDYYAFEQDHSFLIMDYAGVADACFKAAAQDTAFQPGKIVLQIQETGECITFEADGTTVSACHTSQSPDLVLPAMKATQLLFSPIAPFVSGYSAFPSGWLPLPFAIPSADCI